MKKSIQLLCTLSILGLAAVSTFAQPPGGGQGRGRAMMNPEQRAERQAAIMQDSLLLSDELTAEVQEVLTIYAGKMKEAWTTADGDRQSMRASMQSLRKEQSEELEAILGEEKWSRWESIRANMDRRGPRNRGQGQERGKKKGTKKDSRTE